MRSKTVRVPTGLVTAAFGLALFSLSAVAATGPALRIAVGNDSATFYGDGSAPVYTGTCNVTGSPCAGSLDLSNAASGVLKWQGAIDGFTLSNVAVTSYRTINHPYLDIGSNVTSSGAAGIVTISASDSGFTNGSTAAGLAVIPGGVSATYTAYVDNTNALFGQQTIFGTITDAGGSIDATVPANLTFSMTNVETITFSAGSAASANPDFFADVTQAAVQTGSIGVLVWNDLNHNGKSTPDDKEPGLVGWTVNLSGSGTGTTATDSNGNYLFSNLQPGNYTVCVVPVTGFVMTYGLGGFGFLNCATVTLAAGQNLTNVNFSYAQAGNQTSPLTLSCPTGTASAGVYYSSTLQASGGQQPYSYSVSAGSLPPGLSLLNGVISGTPSTAGIFNFTITVSDSGGNTATSTCSGSCSVTTTSTLVFGNTSGSLGTSHLYYVGGTSITAYGYTTSASTAGLYGNYGYGLGIDTIQYNNNSWIDSTHFVQLDLGAAIASGATNGKISILCLKSCTGGEFYDVYGSNTQGSLGSLIMAQGVVNNSLIPILNFGNYRYISVKAHSTGAVQIQSLSFSMATTCSITVSGTTSPVISGDAATIGFWHNKNGQALIQSLNGGPTSTDLSAWLASNFYNLFGAGCTKSGTTCYNLSGKSNADVASIYNLKIFSGTSPKTLAQIMSAALATYVTNSTLAAGTTATRYGFNVTGAGTGTKTYNIGNYGTAIGMPNNSSPTVLALLQQVNFLLQNNGWTSAAADAFTNIFNGINTTGDII